MQAPLQTPPPIPSPIEPSPVSVAPSMGQRDWKSAPKVVKNWAYQLTWLALVFLPLGIFAVFYKNDDIGASTFAAVLYGLLWCVALYLNRALRKGARSAWTVQLILSCLGLIGFPIGTLIHGYILSQWFKPETKAWFGVQ